MAERCKGKRKDGKPCAALAKVDGFCPMHARPGLAAELGRRSGQVRRHANREDDRPELLSPRTTSEITAALGDVFADVRNRKLDPAVGRTLAQVSAAMFRGIELGELEARIARLEGRKNGSSAAPS